MLSLDSVQEMIKAIKATLLLLRPSWRRVSCYLDDVQEVGCLHKYPVNDPIYGTFGTSSECHFA